MRKDLGGARSGSKEALSRSPTQQAGSQRLACQPSAWAAVGDGIGGHCGPNTAEVSGWLASDHCGCGLQAGHVI